MGASHRPVLSQVPKFIRWRPGLPSRSPLPISYCAATDLPGRVHLLGCLRAQPNATLQELGQASVAAGGPALSRTSVPRAAERVGWGRKKSVHATERNTERVVALRRLLVEAVQEADFTRFVFMDKMRLKHLGPVPTGRVAGATTAPRRASAWTRPCPCTAART